MSVGILSGNITLLCSKELGSLIIVGVGAGKRWRRKLSVGAIRALNVKRANHAWAAITWRADGYVAMNIDVSD